jgi:hypothetical protein
MKTNQHNISDELLAAFIDGSTTQEQNDYILEAFKENPELYEEFRIGYLAANIIEDDHSISNGKQDYSNISTLILGGGMAAGTIIGNIFEHSHIPMVAENNLLDDRFSSHHDSMRISDHNMETTRHEAPKQFGEEANNSVSSDVYQGYNDTCAIRSQQLVLNDFGIPVTQEDLINEATQHGWYAQGEGTPLEYVGNLLENHGVEVNRFANANIFNLTNELAQGHKVIIGVDANELWHNGLLQHAKDSLVGNTPNHALIVAGIDTSDPNNVQVILEDPGTGDVAKAYPMEQFMNAWKDSHCFMVSTYEAAPPFSEGMQNFDYAYLNRLPEVAGVPYPEFAAFNHLSSSTPEQFDSIYAGFNEVSEGNKFTDVLSNLTGQIHVPTVLSTLSGELESLKKSIGFDHESNSYESAELETNFDHAISANSFNEYFSAMHNIHSLGDIDSNPLFNEDLAEWYNDQL